jgi:hypothetical protein
MKSPENFSQRSIPDWHSGVPEAVAAIVLNGIRELE